MPFLEGERRRYTRFEFPQALPAAIECINKASHEAHRVTGDLIDISQSGAFVRVDKSQALQYRVGESVALSFVKRDKMQQEDFERMGIVPRLKDIHLYYVDQLFPRMKYVPGVHGQEGSMVCIGPSLTGRISRVTDRGYALQFFSILPESFLAAFFPGQIGVVESSDKGVVVKDILNDSTKRQLVAVAKRKRGTVIFLTEVLVADEVGAGAIRYAQDLGAHVRDCSQQVRGLMFRTGNCLACTATCDESLKAKELAGKKPFSAFVRRA